MATPPDDEPHPPAGAPAVATPPPSADEEPYRERWFFDNPSVGRALRYAFADKRLARAVFINALLLVVVLALIQEAFGRAQLGLYHSAISYGRLAFLGAVGVEAVIVSLLAPFGFLYLFEAERREECFDQVVTSGVSPHRVVFGRLAATLAFVGVVLLSSLPFLLTTVVLDGATVGQVLLALGVLFAYGACLASLAAAASVGIDDVGGPIAIAILAAIVALVAGFSVRSYPVFAAFSPLRHVVVGYNDIAQGLLIGSFDAPAPYGVALPTALVSVAYYAVLAAIALAYVFVGPDLELSRGLDAFDSVSVTLDAEARQARRGVARALLRTVQMRFFYENLGPRAQAISPLVRAAIVIAFFAGAHVVFLGAVWPDAPPQRFEQVARATAYPFLMFFLVTAGLLAMTGATGRSALLSRVAIRLGPARLGRFTALFGLLAFGLAFPALLWLGAVHLTSFGPAMGSETFDALYLLVAGYAGFMFLIALVFSLVTTNPLSATGRALGALFACNLTPAVWIPLFTGNVLNQGSSFLLDLSPLVAAFAIARPGQELPFSRFQGDELERYAHLPSLQPFLWFHLLVGAGCLVFALVRARAELRAAREREEVTA